MSIFFFFNCTFNSRIAENYKTVSDKKPFFEYYEVIIMLHVIIIKPSGHS